MADGQSIVEYMERSIVHELSGICCPKCGYAPEEWLVGAKEIVSENWVTGN